MRSRFLVVPLSADHRALLDAPITLQEVLEAIKTSKLNKTPGSDCLPTELYKRFATTLAPYLVLVCNDILTNGKLPNFWEQARITVIPQKGKDPSNPKSYRPISLLNNDDKLLTSILISRLIPHYINENQTGFIPGRDIMDNMRKTLDIIPFCKKSKILETCILSLDIEKAFDRVGPQFLKAVLSEMGFGESFHVLLTLYCA